MKVDILALGAHPDDVELSCSGTLYNHKKLGQKIAICDLTEGELGSRGTVATRYKEAAEASKILEIDYRTNLRMADGFFENNKENQIAIIKVLRELQPERVLCNAPNDRHPDHGRGAKLVSDACFLSGLKMIDTGQAPWRPKRVFNYIQDIHFEPDFIVDISDSFEKKMESIQAYGTQFFSDKDNDSTKTYISSSGFLNSIEARAQLFGKRIGVKYGEGFLMNNSQLGIKNLDSILLPDIS
jgi:bacillithiol biosynthesis deacetylase BshB1